jgi:hypothetical protein
MDGQRFMKTDSPLCVLSKCYCFANTCTLTGFYYFPLAIYMKVQRDFLLSSEDFLVLHHLT